MIFCARSTETGRSNLPTLLQAGFPNSIYACLTLFWFSVLLHEFGSKLTMGNSSKFMDLA